MRIAGLIQDSIVDGPGLRFTVFVQGCDMHCDGCHNPDALDLTGGIELTVEEIISQMLSNPLTDGLTLTGGEPFLQAADCTQIAAAARLAGKNVWVYSGMRFEELVEKAENDAAVRDLLETTDVLVDGRFEVSARSLSMKWRGSGNQRLIDVQKSLAENKNILLEI